VSRPLHRRRAASHRVAALTVLATAVGVIACDRGRADSDDTITISCGAVGDELALCREGVASWAAETGHPVRVVSTPNDASERLALYQQINAAGASDIDVYQIDTIWPGILASHLIDLRSALGDVAPEHLPAAVVNSTIAGRLVAIPWFVDIGMLFYRADLLAAYGEAVPETWAQLTATAHRIQDAERAAGRAKMWGYVWQGRAYEGLTCNGLEWLASQGAGTIVSPDGVVTVDNPRAVAAIALAASWIGSISPPDVLSGAEEEARAVFQSGHAVFMRNWAYAWSLAQQPDSPIKGRVAVARMPRGDDGSHASTLGGWQLAVSRYSRHPALAISLVRHLTSRAQQKRRAMVGSYNPSIMTLYQDPDVLASNPFMGEVVASALADAELRPSRVSGAHYNQASYRFWTAVHDTLSGRSTAAETLERLARQLRRLISQRHAATEVRR